MSRLIALPYLSLLAFKMYHAMPDFPKPQSNTAASQQELNSSFPLRGSQSALHIPKVRAHWSVDVCIAVVENFYLVDRTTHAFSSLPGSLPVHAMPA